MQIRATVYLAVIVGLTHCGVAEEEVFPSVDSGVVAKAANRTWGNYVKWWNQTKGTPLMGDRELATHLWADGVVLRMSRGGDAGGVKPGRPAWLDRT